MLVITLLLHLWLAAAIQIDTLTRDFSIQEGNQVNYFVSNGGASAHVIVTNATDPRVLIAYPNQNCGTGIWFSPKRPENHGLELHAVAMPRSTVSPDGEGVRMAISCNKSEIVLTECALDSIRVLRELSQEGSGSIEVNRILREKMAEQFPVPIAWARESANILPQRLVLRRAELSGRPYEITLDFSHRTRIEKVKHNLRIASESGAPLSFALSSDIPFPPMHRYAVEELLSAAALKELDRSSDPQFVAALRALLFLSRREKFMAGAWRFMTYFGRDTMISLMMLQDVVSPQAYRDGLQSVLDRLDPSGDVAHEEDIGPWAELDHAADLVARHQRPAPNLIASLQRPVYDYKMVDDDFLLPIMAGRWLTTAERRVFLEQGDNLHHLLSNWDYCLAKALRLHPSDYRTLVCISPAHSVGNWRDSQDGLAGGRYPCDVNADLVPLALEGMARTLQSRLVTADDLQKAERKWHLQHVRSVLHLETLQTACKQARDRFEVSLSAEQVRERVSAYLATFPSSEQTFFNSQKLADASTLGDFLAGRSTLAPLRFWAVSLDAGGKPMAVMNSDFCFRLFLGEPGADDVSTMLRLIELPYPLGLMTPVGPLVANPAYCEDRTWWKKLDRDAYHGAVTWSWQADMLHLGLLRQLQRFHGEEGLSGRLRRAIAQMERARGRAGALANSELRSWEIGSDHQMHAIAFGQRSGAQTESNAVQLWSTVYPAIRLQTLKLGDDLH